MIKFKKRTKSFLFFFQFLFKKKNKEFNQQIESLKLELSALNFESNELRNKFKFLFSHNCFE